MPFVGLGRSTMSRGIDHGKCRSSLNRESGGPSASAPLPSICAGCKGCRSKEGVQISTAGDPVDRQGQTVLEERSAIRPLEEFAALLASGASMAGLRWHAR